LTATFETCKPLISPPPCFVSIFTHFENFKTHGGVNQTAHRAFIFMLSVVRFTEIIFRRGDFYMTVAYTNERIVSPDGMSCAVLDTSKVDYSSAVLGRKSAQTLVRRAAGGEQIETKNDRGQTESVYVTKPGDAIFVNGPSDVYVPADKDGTRWAFSELERRGYETVGHGATADEVIVKNTKAFKILPEVITEPTCIKDAWGPGSHQFLYEGATLKSDDAGRTTGIDRDAFNRTWELVRRTQVDQRKPALVLKT
jgi:hypothetical protein